MDLEGFNETMGRLGSHPDKDIIVRLTTFAMQHQDVLAKNVVDLIQSRVLSVSGLSIPSSLQFILSHIYMKFHGGKGCPY